LDWLEDGLRRAEKWLEIYKPQATAAALCARRPHGVRIVPGEFLGRIAETRYALSIFSGVRTLALTTHKTIL